MKVDYVFGNLAFEYELAGRALSPVALEVERRWESVLRVLPGAREAAVLTRTSLDPSRAPTASVRAWGVTSVLPWETVAPEKVRTVNDKLFSHRVERDLGISMPGSAIASDCQSLERQVKGTPHDWVLKHPFGVGGRERVTGKAHTLSPAAEQWARARFKEGWGLLFEPWLRKEAEYSLHFEIGADARPRYLGHCRLLTDPSGAFRGNAVTPGETLPDGLRSKADQALEIVAAEGYRGPVSLDSMVGFLGSERLVRPVVEINARYSFGRLALELQQFAPQDWCYLWLHPKPKRPYVGISDLPELGSASAPGTYRLPHWADPDGRSGTVIFLAPDIGTLELL